MVDLTKSTCTGQSKALQTTFHIFLATNRGTESLCLKLSFSHLSYLSYEMRRGEASYIKFSLYMKSGQKMTYHSFPLPNAPNNLFFLALVHIQQFNFQIQLFVSVPLGSKAERHTC